MTNRSNCLVDRAPVLVEMLEQRSLLSGGPTPHVYAPDAEVKDQSVAQWAANWWSKVFETPVHAADGTTVINPMLTDDAASSLGKADGVYFLYGSLFGGNHVRSATVPSGTPIFVPILPIEFSNYDTTTGNLPGGEFPGTNTYAQLKEFSAQAAEPALGPGGEVHLSVDGESLPNAGKYREISPKFSYVLPPDSINANFFDPSLIGKVKPVAADGFYVMLKPLSVGQHTIEFGGTTPGGSLGPLGVDITYSINVVPKGQNDEPCAAPHGSSPFSTSPIHADSDVLHGKDDLLG